MSPLITPFQHGADGPGYRIKVEEKSVRVGKGERELPLFTEDVTSYVEIPKELTKKNPKTKAKKPSWNERALYKPRLQGTTLICKSQTLSYIPAVRKWNLK